jgi:two-component system, OmpR family, sensor histidine kinase QseC
MNVRVSRLQSLQVRLVARVLGLVMVLWLMASVVTWYDARHEVEELLDGHLAQAAAFILQQQTPPSSTSAGGSTNTNTSTRTNTSTSTSTSTSGAAPLLHQYAPRVAFQVFHQGQLIARSVTAYTTPMALQTGGMYTRRLEDGSDWRVFAVRNEQSGLQVYVGEQMKSRDDNLLAVLRNVLWPQALALPLLTLAGWWSVRRGLAPLRQLSEVLHRRRPSSLEPVVLGDIPDEMRPPVEALNALLVRINILMESERRFTADAAHELRTPIAAIRAQAQVALGAGNDSIQRGRALRMTLAGCDRATRLVEQMLTLARMETASSVTAKPQELAATAWRVAADLAPSAMARQQVLQLDVKTPCKVLADPTLLDMLLRNLIDNALRYSPDGSRVCVTGHAPAGYAMLRVADSGPGMAPEAIEQLGRRFYRELGTGQSGSGLGWSIVKRIAEVSGAQLQVSRSSALGGLLVSVRWPTAQDRRAASNEPWPTEEDVGAFDNT